MTQIQNNVANLVDIAGVQVAGFAIAEALVLMQSRFGVDLETVIDGLNTDNGAARFNELLAIAMQAAA